MKIINNKTNTHSNVINNAQCSPNFEGKISLKSFANLKNWKIVSAVSAALGMASIAINKNQEGVNNKDYEDLRIKLKEKCNTYIESGYVQPSYKQNDIDLIIEQYKINPQLVDKLINMKVELAYGHGQRFSAISIKNLVTLGKENSELLNKLIDTHTVNENNVVEYTYNSNAICKIMELANENPEFIERILSIKTIINNVEVPKYKKDFEFDFLNTAYLLNPRVTDELISIDELMPKDIKEIAEVFKPDLYFALKESISDGKSFLNSLKKHVSFLKNLNNNVTKMGHYIKEHIIWQLNLMSDTELTAYKKYYPDFDNKINQINIALGKYKNYIRTPMEKQTLFITNILANNNPKTEEILKNFDFAKYQKDGLPLKYSRENFIKKINTLIKDLTTYEQNILLQHFGFIEGDADFDGLITNRDFENKEVSNNIKSIAKEIQKEIELFTLENEVITGNKDADNVLTGLVQGFPEFTYFIGKKQHNTHKYSVDIHTLKVLQNIMNNPKYSALSDTSKTILKMSVLMHDFGKKGGVRDPGHANLSSTYAEGILQKFSFPENMKNRIIEIIDNHHWFEAYNLGHTKPHNVAEHCRYPEDIMIYSMFAKADFENVNDTFHLRCSNTKNEEEFNQFMAKKISPIYEEYNKMRKKMNFVFDTKFMNNGEKFPRETVLIDNKLVELKVLDFHKLASGENLQKYGFAPNVTKENAHFLVHQTYSSFFNDAWNLTHNYSNKVAWSTSLVKYNDNRTIEQYGFIFNADQANISIGYDENLGLGVRRNHQNFFNILFLEENDAAQVRTFNYKDKRTFLRDTFLRKLELKGIKLKPEEFAQLSEEIVSKKHLTQIKYNIKVGKKLINATDIVDALEYARNSLFNGRSHNEVECILPTIKGLFAKDISIQDCPKYFLEFAAKHDLPIVIME